jgi:hypothetical protein
MAAQTERRAANADIIEIKTIVMELRDQMRDHCTQHDEWNKKLCDHELVLYGNRDGMNGDKKGMIQKLNELWQLKRNSSDVFWKIVGGLAVAASLLLVGLK